MSKSTLAIFGATGNQGHSVAQTVLNSPSLSKLYNVRAISRNTSSPKMESLASLGAELVAADLEDPSTLPKALEGAEYLFFMTATQYGGNSREIETRQAKNVCEEAVKQGIKYIIFSSSTNPAVISNGKLPAIEMFDCKFEIEQYIRGLPVQSAFFVPGSFFQNFIGNALKPRPSPSGDGTFVVANILEPDSPVPLLDITDTSAWIAPVLAEPERYAGAAICAAERMYTLREACEILSKVSDKTVTYKQIPDEVYKGFLPEGPMKQALYEMWAYVRDYGYYGGDEVEKVAVARRMTGEAKVKGLEEFLRSVNYQVE